LEWPHGAAKNEGTRFGRRADPTEVAMRLTCPNCDAAYEVPDGMVPATGRHVQCTACHTRWFARGTAAEAPSEEQILTRLEARDARPEPPAPAPEAAEPAPVVPLRPAKPAARPAVPRPADLSVPPRAAPRLDLDPPAAVRPAPPPEPAGRFWLGLAMALLLFLLALGAYDFRQEIAAELPEASPALEGYADAVDDLRDRLESRIRPLRDRLEAAVG
jgi:predicted Zn finger-like uncharacterized protein